MLETLKKLYVLLKNFIKNFTKILTFTKFQNIPRNTYNFQTILILCDRTHVWDATHTFKIFLGSKLTLVGFSKVYLLKTHILTGNLTFQENYTFVFSQIHTNSVE